MVLLLHVTHSVSWECGFRMRGVCNAMDGMVGGLRVLVTPGISTALGSRQGNSARPTPRCMNCVRDNGHATLQRTPQASQPSASMAHPSNRSWPIAAEGFGGGCVGELTSIAGCPMNRRLMSSDQKQRVCEQILLGIHVDFWWTWRSLLRGSHRSVPVIVSPTTGRAASISSLRSTVDLLPLSLPYSQAEF